ncbi:hypothetical protein BD413DRAFT_495547 [Trametes elegans]|nr:hypothetical protein BD413DRAFT_495547 [Trametes elegans]
MTHAQRPDSDAPAQCSGERTMRLPKAMSKGIPEVCPTSSYSSRRPSDQNRKLEDFAYVRIHNFLTPADRRNYRLANAATMLTPTSQGPTSSLSGTPDAHRGRAPSQEHDTHIQSGGKQAAGRRGKNGKKVGKASRRKGRSKKQSPTRNGRAGSPLLLSEPLGARSTESHPSSATCLPQELKASQLDAAGPFTVAGDGGEFDQRYSLRREYSSTPRGLPISIDSPVGGYQYASEAFPYEDRRWTDLAYNVASTLYNDSPGLRIPLDSSSDTTAGDFTFPIMLGYDPSAVHGGSHLNATMPRSLGPVVPDINHNVGNVRLVGLCGATALPLHGASLAQDNVDDDFLTTVRLRGSTMYRSRARPQTRFEPYYRPGDNATALDVEGHTVGPRDSDRGTHRPSSAYPNGHVQGYAGLEGHPAPLYKPRPAQQWPPLAARKLEDADFRGLNEYDCSPGYSSSTSDMAWPPPPSAWKPPASLSAGTESHSKGRPTTSDHLREYARVSQGFNHTGNPFL